MRRRDRSTNHVGTRPRPLLPCHDRSDGQRGEVVALVLFVLPPLLVQALGEVSLTIEETHRHQG